MSECAFIVWVMKRSVIVIKSSSGLKEWTSAKVPI